MEEKLLKIINNYGVIPQLKYFQSEVFELNEAILEYEHDEYTYYTEVDKSHKKHITEELADVMVMLEQFKLYYGITSEEIRDIFWNKVDRQLERIEKEVENENN